MFAADIVGYLFGYAQMTNARALALVGDPEAGAYELLLTGHGFFCRTRGCGTKDPFVAQL